MTSQELKNSILQFAVQGKLVPQNNLDEPASELIKKIKNEKKQLTLDKVLKNEKPLLEITDKDKLFDIPDSWSWVRLGEIGITYIGLTYKPQDISEVGIGVLRSNNIQQGQINYNNLVRVNKIINPKLFVHKGDILICARNGSRNLVGKSAIIEKDGMSFGAFMAIYRSLCNRYIHTFINSSIFRLQLDGANTTTINQITQDMLRNIICPLPPLTEQQRIVDKIEQIMPFVEQYGAAELELRQLNNKFPEQLKKAVLQHAIQGKLIEQNPKDEPASILVERIFNSRSKQLKSKLAKSNFTISEIKEIDIPFEIPEKWTWVKLGDVCNFGNNGSITSSFIKEHEWILELEDIEKDTGKIICYKSKKERASVSNKNIFKSGNVLYSKLRPYLNKVVIVDKDGFCSSEVFPLDFGEYIYNRYAQIYLMSPFFVDYATKMSYGTKMPRFGTTDGQNALFPIPPYNEQIRIVDKVDEILKYYEKLKKQIE